MAKYGIDVSDNQGVIDWKKVKDAGVEFAILRSVRRSGKYDYQLENNIKGCIENDVPADFYKYAYALSKQDSRREANEVVLALETLGVKPSKDVVIWHDIEENSLMELSTKELTEICNAFREVVENAGYTYGLYMGKYDFEKGEVNITDLGMPHIWIARYYDGYTLKGFGEKPNAKYKPTVPGGELWGWQYTSSGRINGINGNVDMNEVYYDITALKQETAVIETKSKTAEKFVAQAQKWVGRKESDGTHKEIVDIYNSHKPLARGYAVKYTDSWCATFVSAVSIETDCTDLVPTECSCQQMIELFKKISCWVENENRTPNVGDIIFYDWDDNGSGDNTGWSDHVGIVEKISNGYMTVIEGNYNDAVGRRVIAVNARYIRGYGVPKFETKDISKVDTTKKTIDEIAKEVIDGKWSSGEERKQLLAAEGYDYESVRIRVNQMLGVYYSTYTGNSSKVDDVLRAIDVPDIYIGNKTKRKPVGKSNGFPNYTGKQNENLAIISLAKKGTLRKP